MLEKLNLNKSDFKLLNDNNIFISFKNTNKVYMSLIFANKNDFIRYLLKHKTRVHNKNAYIKVSINSINSTGSITNIKVWRIGILINEANKKIKI